MSEMLHFGGEFSGQKNFEREPISQEIKFSRQDRKLLDMLIAEGESTLRQIQEIDTHDDEFFLSQGYSEGQIAKRPRRKFYQVNHYILPIEVDQLIRSLKSQGISYSDLPPDAIMAISILNITEFFEESMTSPLIDKMKSEGKKIVMKPEWVDGDENKQAHFSVQKEFFGNLIQNIEILHQSILEKQKQRKVYLKEQNFEKLERVQSELYNLQTSIEAICKNIINFVEKSGKPFLKVFPHISNDQIDFIYTAAGIETYDVSDEEAVA